MNWLATKKLEVGKVYQVCTKLARPPISDTDSPYPFGARDTKVPIRVLGEYPNWYRCEVLEHTTAFTARSIPYIITIDKFELQAEIFKAWEEISDEEAYGVYHLTGNDIKQ